jgi:exonuclease SbcC
MKIIKVTICNINSLRDTYTIDFQKEFGKYGLFLITGDTGSGKSTILDAICVALYGKTPRLSNTNSQTKQLFAINSTQCFSEVEFQVDNTLYKSYWGLSRVSRGKNKGNIKDAIMKLSIYKDNNWEYLDIKKSHIPTTIEQITNLNFDRFTKTVMLAQGSFDAFLKANKANKADILEKITGTQIYKTISMKVFQEYKTNLNYLQDLKSKIDNSQILSEDELKENQQYLSKATKQKETIQLQLQNLQNDIQVLKNIEQYKQNIEQILLNQEQLNKKQKEFEPNRTKISKAIEANQIYTKIKQKENLQLQIKQKQIDISKLEELKNKIQQQLKNIEQDLQATQQKYQQIETETYNQTLTLQKAKEHKAIITEKTNQIISLQNQLDELRLKFEFISIDNNNIKQYIEQLALDIKKLQFTIKDISIEALYQQQKKLEQDLVNLLLYNDLQKQLQNETNRLSKAKQEFSSIINMINQSLQQKQELTKKQEQLKEHQFNLLKIKDYAKDRAKLKDNQQCWLCGSTHHPYKSNTPPNIEDMLQVDIDNYTKQILQLDNQIIQYQNKKGQLEANIANHNKNIENITSQIKQLQLALVIFDQTILQNNIANIKQQINNFIQTQQTIEQKQQQKIALEYQQQYLIKQQQYTILQNDIKFLEQQIIKLLDNKSIKQFEQDILKKQNHIKEALNNLQNNYNQTKNNQIATQTDLKNNKIFLQDIISGFNTLTKEIQELIEKYNFKSEQDVASCVLEDSILKELQQTQKYLDDEQIKLKALLQDTQKALTNEKQKLTTKVSKETLLQQQTELNNQKDELIKNITLTQSKIAQSNYLQQQNKKIYEQIEKQTQDVIVWEKLNELIGQADGGKYQAFVQNLTLGHLLQLANKHLQYLNDRYMLQKENDENLTICIVDKYYFNTKRGTNTLSGGESFLVSLALALGLSDLVNDKINIDTLFLDEGFGTLDTQTLNIAIDALEKLHLRGKLIGIISHVDILKERIFAKIQLEKISNGNSKIKIINK